MEDSNKKELIEIIKERLKAAEELPYKEGAWEAYKAKYEVKPTRKILPAYWAAAAALAIAGFAALFIQRNTLPQDALIPTQQPLAESGTAPQQPVLPNDALAPADNFGAPNPFIIQSEPSVQQQQASSTASNAPTLSAMNASAVYAVGSRTAAIPSLDGNKLFALQQARLHFDAVDEPDAQTDGQDLAYTLAQQANIASIQNQREAGLALSPKKFNFSDKFEIGAFLNPSSTSQRVDVGGGLIVAYQLSDKLAVRTGAAFNQYEVGLVGSQLGGGGVANAPADQSANGAALVSKDIAYRASNVLLPNLNSVSGRVQTLDIPFELKYNVGRQFYATGGVSYAVVLSQERLNNITEYTGAPTYSSASDSDQPLNSSEPMRVQSTVQSQENSVNPNGFGGFVNFSIGRKTKLNRSINLSVEPYIKLPVGQFKRADMDYTNGGLRIITNF